MKSLRAVSWLKPRKSPLDTCIWNQHLYWLGWNGFANDLHLMQICIMAIYSLYWIWLRMIFHVLYVTVRKHSFRVKSAIFFLVWPWNLIDDLEKNGAPPLTYFRLCASFHIYLWIQTGVTVRKRPINVKMNDFISRVTLTSDRWPWKTMWHLP